MKSLKTPPNSLQSQAELTQAELSGQNAVVAKAKQTIDKIFEATAAYPSSPLITPTIFRKTAAQNDPFASATIPTWNRGASICPSLTMIFTRIAT